MRSRIDIRHFALTTGVLLSVCFGCANKQEDPAVGPAPEEDCEAESQRSQTFPDSGLEVAVREVLDNPICSLTRQDLISITVLNASDRQIQTLDGVEHLARLEALDLSRNNLEDVSPLAGLDSLKFLTLDDNQVSDLTPIRRLPALVVLSINNNKVTDVSPLLSVSSLEALEIIGNPLTTESIALLKELQDRGVEVAVRQPREELIDSDTSANDLQPGLLDTLVLARADVGGDALDTLALSRRSEGGDKSSAILVSFEMLNQIEIVIADGSPEDQVGAAFHRDEVIVTTLDGEKISNRRRIDDRSRLDFDSVIQGGIFREGALAAEGMQEIKLIYDFSGPNASAGIRSIIDSVAAAQVLLVLTNDFHVDISANGEIRASVGVPRRILERSSQSVVRIDFVDEE